MSTKHALLHVVQADAGDAFLLEFNSDLTGTNDSTYILIDGGPPQEAHGEKPQSKAKTNLYTLLNTLSGSTVNGDTAPKKPMKKMDTLILTNDDEDHKEGIVSLISSLINAKSQKKGKDDAMNTWALGDEAIVGGKSPIDHIWYNGLEDITKTRASEGIPETKNWFDERLQQYNGLIQTNMTFNADLQTSTSGSKSGRFAVAGAQGVSGGKLKRDQFEFEFIGPLWDELMSNGLLQVLAQPKTIPLPSYKFTQNTLAKSATTQLAGNTLNEPAKQEIDQALKASQITSDKSKSSIAFIASDGETKILLLGDGVASMLKTKYTGTPLDFTVMKVMNHGSKSSNYWPRDAARKAEEANVPVIQENKFDSFQLDVIFFFAKVRAKKYIISASSEGPQVNPHVTTLIGIIAAAQENLTDIDIYLTNPLPDAVLKEIGDLFCTEDSNAISFVTMYQLSSTSHSGAVAVYDHEEDSSDWTPFMAKDIKSTYPETFEENNSGVSAAALSGTLAVPRGSVDISVVTSKLLGVSTATSYEELSAYEPYPTRNVADISELLKYLVSQGDMKQEDADSVQPEIVVDGGLKMGPLLALLMGVIESESVLSALPFDLGDTPGYLGEADSPSEWIVSGFSAKVIDPANSDYHGKKGIFSITFEIPKRTAALTWKLPLGVKFAPDPYYILYQDAISVQVIWPCFTMGISASRFRGQLITTKKSYNAVIESVVVAGQPTIYTVRFADENYEVENFKMSLVDLARVFGTNVQYGEVLAHILLPGIDEVLTSLDINVGINNCGFTMHKDLSTFIVHDMFAEEKLDISWNPFSSGFNLSLKTLRLIVENLYSGDTRKIFIKLLGGTSVSSLNVPFEFTAEYTPQKTILYQLALLPGISDSLSVGTICDVIGLSDAIDLAKTFPAVSNLSNALSVSHVVLGWIKDQAKPASLNFIVILDKWVLSQDVFEVAQIMVDIEVKNLSDSATREFLLRGWGIVKIANIDLEAFFDYSHYADAAKNDEIYFQVGTSAKPIPLGSILLHFLGEQVDVLPTELASMLEETNMDSCIIEAEKADNKWSVKKIQLMISVKKDINVFDGMKVSSPKMTIKIDNPFDKASRTIYVGIDAQVYVADVMCKVTFVVASAEKSIITMTLDAGESPLTAQTLLSQFLPNVDWISLPDSLTFLANIGIKQASLTLEINSGKFSMSEITITAVSTTSLQLWEELSLKQVTLLVSHSKYDGNKVELDAMLTLNKQEDYIGFTIAYSAPAGSKSSGAIEPAPTVSAETSPGAVWSATASYQGHLSVLDVLSDMSGLQLRDILHNIDLAILSDALDIEISKLQVALTHDSSKSSFSFDADLDWLCFSHLRFACAKTSVWEYSFGFAIGSADHNILDDIPVLGPIIDAQVAMEHLTIVVYNYELNAGALDPVLQIPQKNSGGNITLAMATRLVFKGILEDMAKVVNAGTLDIVGTINSQEVTLSVSIGTPITLFSGKLVISGSVIVESKFSMPAPKIGVQGDATLDFGSHISSEPIRVTLMLLVDTSIGGLGFKFTLNKWPSVFGFPGLDIDGVAFAATFPPQQFPVPSEFTIAGTVKLAVGDAGIGGSINVHVVENDLTSSYATGEIIGLNLSNLIQVFAQVPSPPGYLDGGFGPLAFALVPKDTVDVNGKPLSQQFKLNGSFKLPIIHWEARILIDVTPRKVTVEGHIDPVNPFGVKKLFSILASDDDPEGEDAGASIKVHINDETSPFYASVTGKLTFLAIEKEINFEVSQRGLELLLAQDMWTSNGSLKATINDSQMQLAAFYQYTLDLMIPSFSVGGFEFKITRIIGFGASLDLNVNWGETNPGWKLKVSGFFELFTLRIDESFEVGFDIQDLEALGKKIVDFIVDTLAQDFVAALKAILSSIGKVIDVLKAAGMKALEIVKFLTEQLGVALGVAIKAVQEFFGMLWDEVVELLKDLGYVFEVITDILKDIGVAILDIAAAITNVFGTVVKDFIKTLFQGAGLLASEIVKFFRDFFNDPGQALVDLLVSLGHTVWNIISGIGKAIAAPFVAIWNWLTGSTPKRTREQVEQELLLTLMVRMNETLSEPVEIQSQEDLNIIMRRCALERFERNFGYKYDGATSKPPLSQNPGAVTATENQMSYTDGNSGHATDYINKIIQGLNLETWMKDKATADLKEELQDLLGVVPTAFWQVSALEKTYHPSNQEQNPVRLNGIVLFVNGKLSLDGHNVTNTMSFFLGAYYQVPPPTVLARRTLQVQAYASVPEAQSQVIDDASLTSALTAYGAKLFNDEFHFNYNERPSEAANPALFFTTLNALSYYEDKVVEGVQQYLKTKILSKSPLPDWVQDQALGDLDSVYKSLVGSPPEGWRNFKFDHTYTRPGESFNPINSKGIVIYYVDTQTTDEHVPVAISYVFFLGAYYETLNHASVVRQDLINELSKNLTRDMENAPTTSQVPDYSWLQVLLGRYGSDQFYRKNQYELMAEATSPPKFVANTPLYVIEQSGEFESPSSADLDKKIESWVDSVLTSDKFSPVKSDPTIRQNMIDSIKYKLSGSAGFEDNAWSVNDYDKDYTYAEDGNLIVKVVGIFIHVNGRLQLSGDEVKISFLHFSGVCFVEDNPW